MFKAVSAHPLSFSSILISYLCAGSYVLRGFGHAEGMLKADLRIFTGREYWSPQYWKQSGKTVAGHMGGRVLDAFLKLLL